MRRKNRGPEEREMQDELTEAMHSEFTISPETQRKHSAFAVLSMIYYGNTMDEALNGASCTEEDVRKYQAEYEELSGKKVVIG